MVHVDPAVREAYRSAWVDWQKQLATLHEVFLDEASLDPPRLKGLLNREARAKDRYDAARLALLGIEAGGADGSASPGAVPAPAVAPRPPGPPGN